MVHLPANDEIFAKFFSSNKDIQAYLQGLYTAFMGGSICIPYNTNKYNETIGKADDTLTHPFIAHAGNLYMQRYFMYETQLLQCIKELCNINTTDQSEKIAFLQSFTTSSPVPLNEWQKVAAALGFLQNFLIVTGGPGTGKTTTVASILELIFSYNPQATVALAAPTGKAANRMAESLRKAATTFNPALKQHFDNLEPATIHRLLGYIPNSIYFKHNAENTLPHDVIIIDECSMIDVALFSKLLSAVSPMSQLILLGDKDQLSAVEAGSIFGDICKSVPHQNQFGEPISTILQTVLNISIKKDIDSTNILSNHIVSLTYSHRFKDEEGIGKLAHAILHRKFNTISALIKKPETALHIDTDYDKDVFEKFISGYEQYVLEKNISKALQAFNELRVLCAVKEGEHGVYMVNKKIEAYLEKKKLIHTAELFYENRPIMVTQNYNELQIFNGDTGIVRTDEEGHKWIMFPGPDGTFRKILPGYITASETAFAMTIHKSQGSEYNNVLMILPAIASSKILSGELIYTGATRAKTNLVVQATEEVLLHAAAVKVQRASGIENRLSQNL